MIGAYTRGVLFVHSAPRALCPHIEWAAAEVLGIPQGTLMSRISRARAALRAMEGHVPLADSPRAAGRGHLSVVGGADDRTA